MQEIEAAAELQRKPKGVRESLGAGFGEIGRVSDGCDASAHQNLLSRLPPGGDSATSASRADIKARPSGARNRGFQVVNN